MCQVLPCQHSPADSRRGTLCYGAKSRVISLAGFFRRGLHRRAVHGVGRLDWRGGYCVGDGVARGNMVKVAAVLALFGSALLRISLVQAGQV